ncbi:ABC transporter substrate-binding protein [Austwickia chelonae]|uniref:ABC transporter substrate-binding protein n=1 Tax=Austwickia chelonae TaxID=100225 RepID=UPI000E247806|nr:ABC transporter substrate-binding protein [Austwickia chelonae]
MALARPRPGLLAAPAVLVLLLAGCGQGVDNAGTKSSSNSAASVQNCGKTVNPAKTPERIVTMTPGLTDLVVKLGAADKIVGEAQNRAGKISESITNDKAQLLSDSKPPAREKLMSVNPDLVLAPTSYEFNAEQGFASRDQLSQAGASSYISTGGCTTRRASATVTDTLEDIKNLGKLLGKEKEAKELADRTSADLDTVDKAVAGKKKPTVVQLFVDEGKISAIGAGVEYDIIKRAGGDNQFTPTDEEFKKFFAAAISPETLLAKNPDAIVFATQTPELGAKARDYLVATFPQVTAVKENRLVNLKSTDVMPGVLGNVDAVKAVAKGLYPDAL